MRLGLFWDKVLANFETEGDDNPQIGNWGLAKKTSSATAEISHRPHEVHPVWISPIFILDLKFCYTNAFRRYIFQLLIFLILGQNTHD